jgi:hypothetical protein
VSIGLVGGGKALLDGLMLRSIIAPGSSVTIPMRLSPVAVPNRGGVAALGMAVRVPLALPKRAAAGAILMVPASGVGQKTGGGKGNGSPEVSRNPAQDKMLTNGEIKKLQDAGFGIHGLKGGKHTGRYNLYKDAKGNVYLKPRSGVGPGESLKINLNRL